MIHVISFSFFLSLTLLLLQDYYRSGRMLVKLAEAIGRLVLAGRELTRLAGFTARVQELLTVLKDLNTGLYQRTMVENRCNGASESSLVWYRHDLDFEPQSFIFLGNKFKFDFPVFQHHEELESSFVSFICSVESDSLILSPPQMA